MEETTGGAQEAASPGPLFPWCSQGFQGAQGERPGTGRKQIAWKQECG